MISIIVAISKNGVIGNHGGIPWKLSADLRHFAELTKGHTVVMGRKTYESIIKKLGHALPDRMNIVITTQAHYQAPGCVVVRSIQEALSRLPLKAEAFIIGGSEIYKQFLPLAHKLYVTEVDTICNGDAFFPLYSKKEWEQVSAEPHQQDEKNSADFTFLEFVRK